MEDVFSDEPANEAEIVERVLEEEDIDPTAALSVLIATLRLRHQDIERRKLTLGTGINYGNRAIDALNAAIDSLHEYGTRNAQECGLHPRDEFRPLTERPDPSIVPTDPELAETMRVQAALMRMLTMCTILAEHAVHGPDPDEPPAHMRLVTDDDGE